MVLLWLGWMYGIFSGFSNLSAAFTNVQYHRGHFTRTKTEQDSCRKIYRIVKTKLPPVVDGNSGDSVWKDAHILQDLLLHWDLIPAQKTVFKGLYDASHFYFIFEVSDSSIVIRNNIDSEMDVIWEDRIELFFTPDRRFDRYYCLEIDPFGRALENSGALGKKIDAAWTCTDCKYSGTINEKGYILEGKIPISTFRKNGMQVPEIILNAGVYRADFTETNDPNAPGMQWISWLKADAQTPNFHLPSSMGCFIFDH